MKQIFILILIFAGFTAFGQSPLGSPSPTALNRIKGSLKVDSALVFMKYAGSDTFVLVVLPDGSVVSIPKTSFGGSTPSLNDVVAVSGDVIDQSIFLGNSSDASGLSLDASKIKLLGTTHNKSFINQDWIYNSNIHTPDYDVTDDSIVLASALNMQRVADGGNHLNGFVLDGGSGVSETHFAGTIGYTDGGYEQQINFITPTSSFNNTWPSIEGEIAVQPSIDTCADSALTRLNGAKEELNIAIVDSAADIRNDIGFIKASIPDTSNSLRGDYNAKIANSVAQINSDIADSANRLQEAINAVTFGDVLNAGNTTSLSATFTDGTYTNIISPSGVHLSKSGTSLLDYATLNRVAQYFGYIAYGHQQSGKSVYVYSNDLSDDREIRWPDASGTVALTSDYTFVSLSASGTGATSTFTFTVPIGASNPICQSKDAVCTVQSSFISGTTLSIKTVATPGFGTILNFTAFYKNP